MKRITEGNLNSAFAGESMAHMRYLVFGDIAEKEGRPNVARLFRAIAYAEQVHATNHYRELGNIAASPQNLQVAIDGETFEVAEMYPSYRAVAELQGEKGAQRSTDWALQAEKVHAVMYQKARDMAQRSQDIALGSVYICPVCGYTVEGQAPDKCPVCQAAGSKFKAF